MKRLFALVLLLCLIPQNAWGLTDNPYGTDIEAGSTQYWSITDAAQTGLDLTGDFTLSVWVNLESLPSGDCLTPISKTNDGVGGSYVLRICDDTTDTLNSYTIGGGFDNHVQSWGPSAATTYHIVWTYENGAKNYKYYIDGAQLGSTFTGVNTSVNNTTQPFQIGATLITGTPSRKFDGVIDDVRVWSRELSSTEVADLYAEPCSFDNGTNLEGWWLFDNDGTDQTANNNDLTNNNSATFTTGLYSCPASESTVVPYVIMQGDAILTGDALISP